MPNGRIPISPGPKLHAARAILVGFLALAGLCAFAWMATGQLILPGVTVEGVRVGGLTVSEAQRRLAPRLLRAVDENIVLRHGLERIDLAPARAGLGVDVPSTLASAYAPGHRGSLLFRLEEWLGALRSETTVPAAVSWDERLFTKWCAKVRAKYGSPPVDAGWRALPSGQVEVTAGAVGRDLSVEELRSRLERVAFAPRGARSLELPMHTVHPRWTTEQAMALGIREVMARYRTYFNQENANRTGNIRLAAASVRQVVLEPGELFSFNQATGPRIPASGYLEAPVVVGGRLVPGVGGGVCQVSSTVYNAALLADLQVVDRHRHSIPSAYVPPGRDATVAYDYFDLRLRNSRDWPVVVQTELGPGWIEARVLGRRTPGERVEVRTEILETIPPTEERIPDPELPAGQVAVRTKGSPGYRVKVWQIIFRDGAEAERRLVSEDYYQPLRSIVSLGTKPNRRSIAATSPR